MKREERRVCRDETKKRLPEKGSFSFN